MRTIKDAYIGFAAFERKIMRMSHTGWVRWISGNEFVLLKSPYRSNLIDNCSYIAPPDLHPPSNTFIEVDVGGYNRRYMSFIRDSTFLNYRDRYNVLNITNMNINKILNVEKPFISSDEFRYRVTSNWSNANDDKLDWSLPLQILSCAESVYGIGGIGTISLSLAGSSKKPLKDLKSSITQHMPREFINGSSDRYHFGFIDNRTSLADIEKRRIEKKIPEISYNHLLKLPKDGKLAPIQMATTIQNAEYKPKSKEPDLDVLEYLLTALLINPPIDDRMSLMIENDIREIYKNIHFDRDYTTMHFDTYSTIKIANSFCRLELKDQLDDIALDRARSIFKDLSFTFIDAKEDLIKTKFDRETWDIPNVEVSYLDKWRSATDTKILRAISKISKEQSVEWVNRADIVQYSTTNLNIDEFTTRDSLIRLNNLGIIINLDNGTRYKIIEYNV